MEQRTAERLAAREAEAADGIETHRRARTSIMRAIMEKQKQEQLTQAEPEKLPRRAAEADARPDVPAEKAKMAARDPDHQAERTPVPDRKDFEQQRRELQLQRDAMEREALEREQAELQRQRRALVQAPQDVSPQRTEEQVPPNQLIDSQREAVEREVFQRQQQIAAAEREALVEQIKAARQQQTLEMEMLREKVSQAEDARRTQQAELERLKEEVTKGSVYQEILQHFKLTPAVAVQETLPQHAMTAVPAVEVAETQTAEVSTRSISVEAVPEIPRMRRPQRPDPHALELGLQQGQMLERMLLKVVVQGWQAAIFESWRLPPEFRVRDVPWQTPPEEPLVPRPRGHNFVMHAELAAKGLSKWSEADPEGPLSTADLYEANARAHATFARWAVSASQRHRAQAFEQRQADPLSAEDQAAERAVQRASQTIEEAVQQDLLLEELRGGTAWPPPLLPPRPVLPGDAGWQERVQRSGRLFAAASADMPAGMQEEVLFVRSDGFVTSFHAEAPEGPTSSQSAPPLNPSTPG
ncbi:unnamed protein product [Symbiodinium natans]|uniref:Uncharacterized protein n=1 Tax=Symbiodinium natans TaxID=878477 RepID=A0A812UB36_9DINO|nr:unnamed protein product [Symbiodinium natans]